MPCLILTGHPCAGKSTLARQIRERALLRHSRIIDKVLIFNESTTCPDQSIAGCYSTSAAEKKTRAALKAACSTSATAGRCSAFINWSMVRPACQSNTT